eukprot:Rhum_TRINITY_DN7717_c0_g1::Rhum_TRINITY_DN7717_c0_g1_i1::g.24397::m.24397
MSGGSGDQDSRFIPQKSGYSGHIPMFPKPKLVNDGSRHQDEITRLKKRELKGLYMKYYVGLADPPQRDTRETQHLAASSFPQHPASAGPVSKRTTAAGGGIDRWSLRSIPTERQQYPCKVAPKPCALGKIVGYGGHRQGSAFIAGETFTQEQIMHANKRGSTAPCQTYEPDKSIPKGRVCAYSAGPGLDQTPWLSLNSPDDTPQPHIPGGLLRNHRTAKGAMQLPPSSPVKLKQRPFPSYPIMRGPSRVRIGGHDTFLVN